MSDHLDFVRNDIQRIESGENGKVIFQDTFQLIVGIVDHVECDPESDGKKDEQSDCPSHNFCSEGVAHIDSILT